MLSTRCDARELSGATCIEVAQGADVTLQSRAPSRYGGAVSDNDKVSRERDLYRRLLDLGSETQIEPFLTEALTLVVEATGASRGYLELFDDGDDGPIPRWSTAHGFSDDELATVRASVSRGIIAETIAARRTIVTASAQLDPRFRDRGSVQAGRIEAVLSAPIGENPPAGVLYLQGANGSGSFTSDDQSTAETFARHLAPFVDRLRSLAHSASDPTESVRRRLDLRRVVGCSPALATMLQDVALVAPLDITVLLTGASGTGKSQIARLIHDNGPRGGRPFVELNCGALPETLVESELFGALPGAHSTATHKIPGKVAAAEQGTLFLDEIADLAPSAQSKLLQLLQTRQYHPLGASRPVHADIRVIAATNVDLQAAVNEHRFREDLLYRLQVLCIRMPSLAERRGDVPLLAAHFCIEACERHRLPRLELTAGALRALDAAEWPGNVRQLANVVEVAAIRAAGDGTTAIEAGHLFPNPSRTSLDGMRQTFQGATREFQAQFLRRALDEAGWNIAEVARRLDLARSHVYNLVRAFGLERRGS